MRIIVFSDSHGMQFNMSEALIKHPEADIIIFLGDGERDFEKLTENAGNRKVVKVCGNCDLYSQLPVNEIIDVAGKRIFCSHGHTEYVKHGTQDFINKARSLGAHIALYGHTHQAVTSYDDGLYVMNPGAVMMGEYGIIDITPSGIMLLPMKV